MYQIIYSRYAQDDINKIMKSDTVNRRVHELLDVLRKDPFEPPYIKLTGWLEGFYSRKIDIRNRLIYQFCENAETGQEIIRIFRIWIN